MYNPRHSVDSPFSPIMPTRQSAFDFSPNAIIHMQSSKNTGVSTSTPNFSNISYPNQSAINYSSSTYDVDLNSTWKKIELMSLKDGYENSLNISNINNRRLNVSTILDDLGLKQYKGLFEMQEIDLIAFLLLTDDDLQVLGVRDHVHRKIFTNAIKKFCGTSD